MTKQEMLDEIKEVLHECRNTVDRYWNESDGLGELVLDKIEDKIEELEND